MEEAPEVSAVATATVALAHHESLSSEKRMEAEKVVLLAFRYFDKTCEPGGGRRENLQAACAPPCCHVPTRCRSPAQVTAELLLRCCVGFQRPLPSICPHMGPGAALWSLPAQHAGLLHPLQAAGSFLWQTGCAAQPCDMAT